MPLRLPSATRRRRSPSSSAAPTLAIVQCGACGRRYDVARLEAGQLAQCTCRFVFVVPDVASVVRRPALDDVLVFGRGLATDDESLHGRLGAREQALLDEASALAARLGVALAASGGRDPRGMLSAPPAPEPWRECRRPFESAVVLADGDVVPCCIATFVAPRGEIRLGNVLGGGWTSVWFGDRYRRLRQGLTGGSAPAYCRGCGVRWSL